MRNWFRTTMVLAFLGIAWVAHANELVDAARDGNLARVRALVDQDPALVRATDEEGYGALHWAAIRGHWDVFQLVLAAGAPVDTVGADGGTPLHWACHWDRADMVAMLLDRGADLTVANRWGRTPLHVAARRGCAEVAALLLACGADPRARTREGWTPLHVAYRGGHPDLVDLLLARGADPDALDDTGRKPAAGLFVRPPAVTRNREALDAYVGTYDIGSGGHFRVWREGDRLLLMDFAPDEIYPFADDRFQCRREPWQVTFRRDAAGAVSEIEVRFLRRAVRAVRHRPAHEYVGSRRCLECHTAGGSESPAVTWLRSRHGLAYWRLATDWAAALAARGRPVGGAAPLQLGRCRSCHITGAGDPSSRFAAGFRPEEGVGCEACHGPGGDYAVAGVMRDRARFLAAGGERPDELTCRRCHRDERFDYQAALRRLGHPGNGGDPRS
jgi:hypothetical protein